MDHPMQSPPTIVCGFWSKEQSSRNTKCEACGREFRGGAKGKVKAKNNAQAKNKNQGKGGKKNKGKKKK